MATAVQIGGLALIVAILALAQRLGGWENKALGRVLVLCAAGLSVAWLLYFVPRPLAWWLVSFVVLVLLMWGVSLIRNHSKGSSRTETGLSDERLDTERTCDQKSDPVVRLDYECHAGPSLMGEAKRIRDRPFAVMNRGGSDAVNIQITLDGLPRRVSFPAIAHLPVGETTRVHPLIDGVGVLQRNELEHVLIDTWDQHRQSPIPGSVKFCTSVRYEDYAGTISPLTTKSNITR